jgi:hypothetical protein
MTMMMRNDPWRMPEPPPTRQTQVDRAHEATRVGSIPPDVPTSNGALLETLRLAAEIARPALRLTTVAAAVLLLALMYRLGASTDPGAAGVWGLALIGVTTLGLMELPPDARRWIARGSQHASRSQGGIRSGIRSAIRGDWGDRMRLRSARRWASAVTLLAMASVALLVAEVAAGSAASLARTGIAIVGVLTARALLLVERSSVESQRARSR